LRFGHVSVVAQCMHIHAVAGLCSTPSSLVEKTST